MSVRSICRVAIPAGALAALLLGGSFVLGACSSACRDVTDGWWPAVGSGKLCWKYDASPGQVMSVWTTAGGVAGRAVDQMPIVKLKKYDCDDCTYECDTNPSKATFGGLCPVDDQTDNLKTCVFK